MSAPPQQQYVFQGQQPQGVMAAQPVMVQQPQLAPGSVMYYPQMQGGAGTVYLVPPQQRTEPIYKYTPSDFLKLSLVVMVVCGIFSPLSLAFSVPAYCFSLQSRKSSRSGAIKLARRQGVIAAYLNVFAVIFALVVAILAVGLAIGLYGPEYALQRCINRVKANNGGVLPPPGGLNQYGHYSSSFVGSC